MKENVNFEEKDVKAGNGAAMLLMKLVVLCGSKEAQPVVNSGSIY